MASLSSYGMVSIDTLLVKQNVSSGGWELGTGKLGNQEKRWIRASGVGLRDSGRDLSRHRRSPFRDAHQSAPRSFSSTNRTTDSRRTSRGNSFLSTRKGAILSCEKGMATAQ